MGIYWEFHDENGDIPWEYNGRNITIKHGGHAELPEFNVCIKPYGSKYLLRKCLGYNLL
jgi:hypothetical protein